MKKPTILDVADLAEVACGTVSRYINGQKLKEVNRLKIEQAIAKLDFQVNSVARAMKTSRTYTIGFIVPMIDEFNAEILTRLIVGFKKHGYTIITFHHSGETESIIECFDSALSSQIDGLILAGYETVRDHVKKVMARDIPVTIFNNDIPDLAVDKVLVNNFESSRDMTTRMIEMGHQRIGFVSGNLSESSGEERFLGYCQALKDKGIIFDEKLIYYGKWRKIDGYFAFNAFRSLDLAPTAVFFSSSAMTVGALNALTETMSDNNPIPNIVSFDDSDMFNFIASGISAIEQPCERVAEYLIELLLPRLKGTEKIKPRKIRLACDFKLRGSLNFNNSEQVQQVT